MNILLGVQCSKGSCEPACVIVNGPRQAPVMSQVGGIMVGKIEVFEGLVNLELSNEVPGAVDLVEGLQGAGDLQRALRLAALPRRISGNADCTETPVSGAVPASPDSIIVR